MSNDAPISAQQGAIDPVRKGELLDLFRHWAVLFGYTTGKIVINSDDEMAVCATGDCTLTAHAPLWRVKPGAEKAVPATTVRRTIQRLYKFVKIDRHNMYVAVNGTTLCLFFTNKLKLRIFPFFNAMTVPLVFVAAAIETPHGLRFNKFDEWPASSVEEATKVLVKNHSWPETSPLLKHVDFGTLS